MFLWPGDKLLSCLGRMPGATVLDVMLHVLHNLFIALLATGPVSCDKLSQPCLALECLACICLEA